MDFFYEKSILLWYVLTLNLLLANAGNDLFSTGLMPFEIEMSKSLMAWKPIEIYDAVGFGWVTSYSFADIEGKNS